MSHSVISWSQMSSSLAGPRVRGIVTVSGARASSDNWELRFAESMQLIHV